MRKAFALADAFFLCRYDADVQMHITKTHIQMLGEAIIVRDDELIPTAFST